MAAIRIRPIATTLAVAAVLAIGIGAAVMRTVISRQVDTVADMAGVSHPEASDRIEALLTYVADESHALDNRDRAIWALGRVGDARALPTLQTYYTGEACEHTHKLCQYELFKAIKRCGGVAEEPWSGDH